MSFAAGATEFGFERPKMGYLGLYAGLQEGQDGSKRPPERPKCLKITQYGLKIIHPFSTILSPKHDSPLSQRFGMYFGLWGLCEMVTDKPLIPSIGQTL